MRKGLLIALLALCAVLVGALLVFFAREQGPRYGGRSLSQWVVLCRYGDCTRDPFDGDNNPSEREAASAAIQQVGSNAVPWLLEWMQYEQPAWKRKVEDFRDRHGLTWIPVDRAELRAASVPYAFESLGPEGRAAIPELTTFLNMPANENLSFRAAHSLSWLGAAALPPLMAAVTNGSPAVRLNAVISLANLGTNARPAIPQLMGYFKGDDETLARTAAVALGRLRNAPDVIVPFLSDALRGPHRGLALHALGALGEQSRLALPKLVELCDDADEDVCLMATNAIREIAPETLKKPKRQ